MIESDREAFGDVIDDFARLFQRQLEPGVASQYYDALRRYSLRDLQVAAVELKLRCRTFPTIAAWAQYVEQIRAAARAQSAQPSVPPDTDSRPAGWPEVASVIVVFVRLAGGQIPLGDPRAREYWRGVALDELRVLREEFNSPADVPRERYRAERSRIVATIVERLAAETPAEASA